MKKRTRDVLINGTSYSWVMLEGVWPAHTIKIWCKNRDKIAWCEALSNKPENIKSKNIANIVTNILADKQLSRQLQQPGTTYKCHLHEVCTNLAETV